MLATTVTSISSTLAKQCFGQLLKASESAPVAIEKHGKVHSFMVSADYFARFAVESNGQAARNLARMRQSVVEKDRLIRHQRIAFDLATLPVDQLEKLIDDAKAIVARWRAEQLCSSVYIEMWDRILSMKPVEMGQAMVSDDDGWGPSLRQNSPWVGVHA